jgi:hypothetical protein
MLGGRFWGVGRLGTFAGWGGGLVRPGRLQEGPRSCPPQPQNASPYRRSSSCREPATSTSQTLNNPTPPHPTPKKNWPAQNAPHPSSRAPVDAPPLPRGPGCAGDCRADTSKAALRSIARATGLQPPPIGAERSCPPCARLVPRHHMACRHRHRRRRPLLPGSAPCKAFTAPPRRQPRRCAVAGAAPAPPCGRGAPQTGGGMYQGASYDYACHLVLREAPQLPSAPSAGLTGPAG